MDKLDPKSDGVTQDIVGQSIEKLKELFPEVFTEGNIDFETLRETLGDYVDDRQERYNFTWNGKALARRITQTPSTGTLRPCPEESVNWDTTQNLFIEGDNLEVLKLLQKSYHKKVKMIYIDPPYNTGKEFIYPDRFQDNLDTYLRYSGQVDDEGLKLSANTETSGRYHTNWLNMMYPRLKLARNLLKDDGVIFISIDDNEVANLRKICDEVFGEENFVGLLAVQVNPRGRHLDRFLAKTHESVLIFGKNCDSSTTMYGVEKESRMVGEYDREDERGKYRTLGLRNRNQAFNPETRPNLYYPIYVNPDNCSVSIEKSAEYTDEVWPDTPDGVKTCWTWGREKVVSDSNLLLAEKTNDGWRVFRKDYLLDESGNTATTLVKSLWYEKELNNDYGRKAIKELFEKALMDFPKSPYLLKKMISSGTSSDDIILDFFAGSCTTADAVLDLNKEEGSNRTFIMVQLPEPCDEKSEAFKAGYKNIAEIGKERIRRVIQKLENVQAEEAKEIKEVLPGTIDDTRELDLGFKVFKLDASNIKPWDADFDNLESALLDAVENIKADRSEADVLHELLLKYGLDLAVPIEERLIAESTVYIIGAGALIVCLADEIALEVVEGIAALKDELKPEVIRVVFKDAGFSDDVVKTNAVQILHQAGIDDVKSL